MNGMITAANKNFRSIGGNFENFTNFYNSASVSCQSQLGNLLSTGLLYASILKGFGW